MQGIFEILSLKGLLSFGGGAVGTSRRPNIFGIVLAKPDGRVFGGCVAGPLVAAGPVQVGLTSFPLCSALMLIYNKEEETLPLVWMMLTILPSDFFTSLDIQCQCCGLDSSASTVLQLVVGTFRECTVKERKVGRPRKFPMPVPAIAANPDQALMSSGNVFNGTAIIDDGSREIPTSAGLESLLDAVEDHPPKNN